MHLYSLAPPELEEFRNLARTYVHTLGKNPKSLEVEALAGVPFEGFILNQRMVVLWSQDFDPYVRFTGEDRESYLRGGGWTYLVLDVRKDSSGLRSLSDARIRLNDPRVVAIAPNWYRALHLALSLEAGIDPSLAG